MNTYLQIWQYNLVAPCENVPPSHGFLSSEAWPHYREQLHCFDVSNHGSDHERAPKISSRFQILTRQVGKWRRHRRGGELLPLTVTNNWYREHRPNPRPLLDWISPLGWSCRSLVVRRRFIEGFVESGCWSASREARSDNGQPLFTRPSAHKSARPCCC